MPRLLLLLLAPLLGTLGSCSFTPPPVFPRPALPLPAPLHADFALPDAPRLLRLDADGETGVADGEIACGAETIHFHLHRADVPERPLVLLVPILAGGEDLMRLLARRFVARGYHAAWCDRAGAALRPPQRGADLHRLFMRTVLHQRALLAWLPHCDSVRPPAIFACGVSMGGMVTAALAAVEPGLTASAMCLAGADLPAILLDSGERRIEEWRDWRRSADGIAGSPLRHELEVALQCDPLRLAPFVATDRVLLVATRFDDVVRPRYQDLLWEALGRPGRLSVPLGHYSSALALDAILDAIASFFDERRTAVAAASAHP